MRPSYAKYVLTYIHLEVNQWLIKVAINMLHADWSVLWLGHSKATALIGALYMLGPDS